LQYLPWFERDGGDIEGATRYKYGEREGKKSRKLLAGTSVRSRKASSLKKYLSGGWTEKKSTPTLISVEGFSGRKRNQKPCREVMGREKKKVTAGECQLSNPR